MRWQKSGFLGNEIEEIGCMTDREEEAYWREYKMKKATQPQITIQNQPSYAPRSPVYCSGTSYGNSSSFSCY